MKFRPLLLLAALAALATACNGGGDDDDVWNRYEGWRTENTTFFEDQQARLDPHGQLYYQRLTPSWNPGAAILVRYLNDRSKTEGNLRPLYNSTCDVIYRGHLCNDVPFDSSYNSVAYGDSIFRCRPGQVIQGWAIALTDMRVGDSAQIVVPYSLGYGAKTGLTGIPPYSTLVFDLKLVDIPYYELRP